MAYSVIVPVKIQAKDVDAWNRSAICASDMENGFLLAMTSGQSTTAGQTEVWTAVQPATANLMKMWMVYSPEISMTVSGTKQYRGLSNDPTDFYIPAGFVFDVFLPRVGDIIIATADCLYGSKAANTYVVATDSSWQLNWAAAPATGLSYLLLDTTYLSIPNGSIGTQRVTAYKFECVAVA